MKELPKVYDPRDVESRIYKLWMDGDCFKAEPNPDKKPFSIVMPPPNVTGQLHMGHALDCTLQDILTRFKRMQGYEALWLPGSDHAGIATQIKVEEELRVKEGLTRYDLGREKFLERVWAWKEKFGNRIVEQQKKLGDLNDQLDQANKSVEDKTQALKDAKAKQDEAKKALDDAQAKLEAMGMDEYEAAKKAVEDAQAKLDDANKAVATAPVSYTHLTLPTT